MSSAEEPAKSFPNFPGLPSSRKFRSALDDERVFPKFHHHSMSDSSNTVSSLDSSPTTTISTVDDSSATEPSPGSSPESPPPNTFTVGMRPRTADSRSAPFFELQKQPPPKKGRNLKNLAVNTSRAPSKPTPTSNLALKPQLPLKLPQQPPEVPVPMILSPAFVKPPTPRRRKPNNLGLTIATPGGPTAAPQEVIRLAIPPTPGFGRPGTLRRFQSSPSLPLSQGFGAIPRPSDIYQQRALDSIFSPIEAKQTPKVPEEEEEQNFDVPLSREEKPEAYPDGPICVYDPNIDLYLEPTAAQAGKYDVVMNVASEVRNPFLETNEPIAPDTELRIDGGGGIQYAPKRDRGAVAELHSGSDDRYIASDNSPSTPKASTPAFSPVLTVSGSSPPSTAGRPEYIHVPWEHNSDIVPDLLRLVKLIDEKVKQDKRVLIHCQCGVSRSASLVVAYGLFKNPAMSVQEAYDAVKRRSKWIGPNMNLIMQLQEFRSSLARGGRLAANRALSPVSPSSALSEWRMQISAAVAKASAHDGSMSAVEPPSSLSGHGSDVLGAITPGPSSAPSGFAWPTVDKEDAQRVGTAQPAPAAFVDPSGHVVSVLKLLGPDAIVPQTQSPSLPLRSAETSISAESQELSVAGMAPPMSPRATEFAMAPLKPTKEVESADSFGIMSPTSNAFPTSVFDRSALLASLGMGSMHADEETPRRSLSLRSYQRPITQRPAPTSPEPPSTSSSSSLSSTASTVTLQQPPRRLHGKISSPTLREQHQLHSLQAKIEATLPSRSAAASSSTPHLGSYEDPYDDALMSPRATEFTNNPFALSFDVPPLPPMPTFAADDQIPLSLSSPTSSSFPSSVSLRPLPLNPHYHPPSPHNPEQIRSGSSPNLTPRPFDPRSPAQKGASPITRNILDVL